MGPSTPLRTGLIALALFALAPAARGQPMNAKVSSCSKAKDAAQCFLEAAKDANQTLNDTYNRIWKSLSARPKQQAQLQADEDMWLRARSADCAKKGAVASALYYACVESQTRARTAALLVTYGK